eukprot:222389-Pyramimonas_sp.AAC.1
MTSRGHTDRKRCRGDYPVKRHGRQRNHVLDVFSGSDSLGKAALRRGFNNHGFGLSGPQEDLTRP